MANTSCASALNNDINNIILSLQEIQNKINENKWDGNPKTIPSNFIMYSKVLRKIHQAMVNI